MTAGHNALRGSGPGQKPGLDNAMALVGCPDRRMPTTDKIGYSDFRVEFASSPVDVASCRNKDGGLLPVPLSSCGQLEAAMSMRQTIAVISQMEADGIIGRYAIGGAVASFLYIDVTFTEDLDILVSLDNQTGKSGPITLGPITKYLADP
jgi:hypothetical protein